MLKVINGGIETLVEDWPGRLGFLGKGMAPSGAFDNVALGFANLLVGNPPGEAAFEVTGGFFEAEFGLNTAIAVTGTPKAPLLNGKEIPMWETLEVQKGDIIKFCCRLEALEVVPIGEADRPCWRSLSGHRSPLHQVASPAPPGRFPPSGLDQG